MPEPEARSGAYEAAREGARAWLTANWDPGLTTGEWWARLAESGWGFPTWPQRWFGKGMSADEAAGVRAAYASTGALGPPAGLGQLLGGPTLLVHGSDEQKARFLPPIADGTEAWCQFFSEPGSGSDLASAQTRAVPGEAGWTVDGQKVWTSGAQFADRGMLLARTDASVPKHQGLSYFIIDIDQPGIEVRPLHQMNGAHGFNEVFFTGAHADRDRLVGEVGGGWSVAVTTLMYERVMSAIGSAAPGVKGGQLGEPAGRAAARAAEQRSAVQTGVSAVVVAVARELDETADPVRRQQLAALWARETTNGYLARGGQSARDARRPGAQGSLTKLARSQLARAGREAGMSVLGAHGMLASADGPGRGQIQLLALSSPGASIAGGTDEIQRGIVGERVLGLPREPRQDRDVPFRELTVGTQRTRD